MRNALTIRRESFFHRAARRPGEMLSPLMFEMAGRVSDWVETSAALFSSRDKSHALNDPNAHYRQLAYTFTVIALAVKLTKCDGELSRDEFIAFREVFPLDDEESAKIRQLFKLAWEDEADATYYAQKAVALYPDRPELKRELLAHLTAVALADGALTSNELKLLTTIGNTLGFNRLQMGRILSAPAAQKRAHDPFRILGVKKGTPRERVKAQYTALMKRYHPDRVAASTHYPEAVAVAERRSVAINKAYESLA